jgi:hypothetical protein
MPIRIVPANVDVALGDGYDLSTETVKASGLELPEAVLARPELSAASASVKLTSASSVAELISSLSVSASGEANLGVASANARGSLALDLNVSEYQQHLVISSIVEFVPVGLRGQIRLHSEALEVKTASIDDFREVYGNGYVHSITYGGQLEIVISVSTRSEKQRLEVQTAFGASVSLGKVTEEAKVSLQKFASEGRLTATVVSQGFVGGVALSLDDALKLAAEFRDRVSNAPRPIKFEVRRYPIPRLEFSSPVDVTTLSRIDEKVAKLVAARTAFFAITTNREQFCNPVEDKALARISTITTAIEQLRDAKAATLAGRPLAIPEIDEKLYYIPTRWEQYPFNVMVATATPYRLTEVVPGNAPLHYRIVGRFTIEAQSPNRWRGADSDVLDFFLRDHEGNRALQLNLRGSLPEDTVGTLLVTVKDSTAYPDNETDSTDPIRLELAREVIY